MTRFFFDLSNGDGLTRDDVGIELVSARNVRDEASRIMTGIASDEMLTRTAGAIAVIVRDASGREVFSGKLTFDSRWHGGDGVRPGIPTSPGPLAID
jgi:hypothetical protein